MIDFLTFKVMSEPLLGSSPCNPVIEQVSDIHNGLVKRV